MTIYDNGVYREMTTEEIANLEVFSKIPLPAPTPEQEVAELKAQLAAMQAAYERGVNA